MTLKKNREKKEEKNKKFKRVIECGEGQKVKE